LGGYFDLPQKKNRTVELEHIITQPDFWHDQERATRLSREYEQNKDELQKWQLLVDDVEDLLSLLELTSSDPSLLTEIETRLVVLEKKYQELEFLALFVGEYDRGDVWLSIHAGTGGVDAQDFAQILMRMYTRFCQQHAFDVSIVDTTPATEAGIKNVTLAIKGLYAYGWLRAEHGVHRLVRISPFDAEGMRHTSFTLVEVLPHIEQDTKIVLRDEDLRIDVFRAGGKGGQSVNTTDSAVRITHIPTGITVKCQNERSQLQNKMSALKILKSKLVTYYHIKNQDQLNELKGEHRQTQWGSQVRSYVLQPYTLVKDHRTGHETSDVERVLDGDIDNFAIAYLRSNLSADL
jgi:peptide chain release factor 2